MIEIRCDLCGDVTSEIYYSVKFRLLTEKGYGPESITMPIENKAVKHYCFDCVRKLISAENSYEKTEVLL